ncbi:flagellar biosynthetic protein FliO [Cellulomonas taurus]|uniref:flagellar biosynthetic protein FliO n=1 Tax=Cellulomonas taurus TaxID=2729175 RepID=UPI00145EAB46|nr:flagellar biosynthetic protein FliO [Cellulomonas taurus]
MDTLVLAARTALALACVLGLIWVVARKAGWGKAGRRAAGPAIEVVGRQALGRHAGVAVLAIGERRLLVGFGEQQVTMLSELDSVEAEDAAAVTEPVTAPVTVRGRLDKPLFSWRKPGPVPTVEAAPAGAPVPSADFAQTLAAAQAESDAPATAAVGTDPTTAAAVALVAANSALTSAARLMPSAVPAQRSAGEHRAIPGLAGSQLADVDLDSSPAPVAASGGSLDGSILAPSTWKQAVSALRERTVRR